MKGLGVVVIGGYLLLAVGNKVAEAAGAMRCGCADDCWCKRPGPNLFRWVFPWRHRPGNAPAHEHLQTHA
jgi:hypothetical protein